MFKVGDHVLIKPNANEIMPSHHLTFAPGMVTHCGQHAVVFKVRMMRNGEIEYMLKDLNDCDIGGLKINGTGFWYWDKNWLEYEDTNPIDISDDDLIGAFA